MQLGDGAVEARPVGLGRVHRDHEEPVQSVQEELRGEVGIDGVELARLHAPVHQFAHQCPSPLERIVFAHAGLVEQHVVERVVLLRPVEEARRELCDRGLRRGLAELTQCVLDCGREALQVAPPELGEELRLRGEVQIDGPLGDARDLRHLGHRGLDAPLHEHSGGAVEDLGPPDVRRLSPPVGAGTGGHLRTITS